MALGALACFEVTDPEVRRKFQVFEHHSVVGNYRRFEVIDSYKP